MIDFWSLNSQNSIKQIDFTFELLDMYENWTDKSKIRFINVCIEDMPEEMNSLISSREWEEPMEFLIGVQQNCETIMVDKEGKIAFKGHQVHRNIEEDVENLLRGNPITPEEKPQTIDFRDPSEEINLFYEESKKMQDDQEI